ncbi:carbonic anhydrase 2-like [Wyeomyia smithii]|uniref:carbonic anhydrase 2-like n=1 Tax=Wyeomyia smithii TaxID=174621 RepID=UPI0024680323|nr:carbonic anhydrase 2-like [Wyeomyia smithii]
MKLTNRQQYQWILLNYLIFLPWMSCQRLNINRNREEEHPRPLQRRSVSFRDADFPISRASYRSTTARGIVFPSQAHRLEVSSNPDFHFDYSREERPTNIGRSNSVILARPRPLATAEGEAFSYQEKDKNGPSNWQRSAPQCGGRYQSPIMLNTDSALIVRNKRPLQLIGQTNLPQGIRLQNDGHSAKFTYIWNSSERPYLRGGPLKTKYNFEQFHFHWGSNSTVGSEHVLDSLRFPMELHLLFYNALYDSFEDARNEVDGLAVVGLFYEIYDDYNEPLNTWTRFLKEIINPDTEFNIPFIDTFPLYDLIGDVEWPYFSYEGSLTTPPCLETVTWIVSTKPLLITPKEIKEFRRLKSRSGMMVNNFRPVQKLFNRRVFRY